MKYLLYLIAITILLSATGCIFPGDRGGRGEREGRVDVRVREGGDHYEHDGRDERERDHDEHR